MKSLPKAIRQPNGDLLLPRRTHEFIAHAVDEAAEAFVQTNGLLATEHTVLPDGVDITGEELVEIENDEAIEKLNLVGDLLRPDRRR